MKLSSKYILFVLSIVLIADIETFPSSLQSSNKPTVHDLLNELVTGIAEIMAQGVLCYKSAGFNETDFSKMNEDQFKKDPKFKFVEACLLEKQGLLNTNGTINVEEVKKRISSLSPIKQEIILEKCVTTHDLNVEETAHKFISCREETENLDKATLEQYKIRKIRRECIESTHADEKLVKKLEKEPTYENAELKPYVRCMFQKQNYLHPNGTINEDEIILGFNGVVGECSSLKGTTTSDTTYLVFKCLQKKTPQ